MRRIPAVTFSAAFILIALSVLTACGKNSSSTAAGTTTQIAVSPLSVALAQGDAIQLSATPEDANNNSTSATVSFNVVEGGSLASVSVNGLVCAGSWDSLTTPVVCTPPPPTGGSASYGKAVVRASVGTITKDVIIDVLPPLDSVTIAPAAVTPDPAGLDCISQSDTINTRNTRTYTAHASFKGTAIDLSKISDAVGWSIGSTLIGSTPAPQTVKDANGTVLKDSNGNDVVDTTVGTVTASVPGKTQVVASIGRLRSTPVDFIVCPVSQISLADSASPATTMPIASGTSITLKPTINDSKGNAVSLTSVPDSTGATTSLFSLSWNSLQPIAASVSTSGVVTPGATAGTTGIIASCTPSAASPATCNLGLGAVYGPVFFPVSVSGTTSTTVYVASRASFTESDKTVGKMFAITTSDNKVGSTAITLPDVPNSMLFNRVGNALYIGTASGLLIFTPSTNAVSNTITGAPGTVLTISPDGSSIIVSDGSNVYIVSSGGAVQTLNIGGVTAAEFAPDNSKAYLVGTSGGKGQITVFAGGTLPIAHPIGSTSSASDVSFLAGGAFAYIADSDGLSVYATCSDQHQAAADLAMATPSIVRTLPDGKHALAVNSPNVTLVSASTDNKGFVAPGTGCAPAVINTAVSIGFTGVSAFSPGKLILAPDGTRAFLTSDNAKLLSVTINGSTLAESSITLSSTAGQTTGGVTLDGKQVYVGGKDNQVHHIDLTAATPTDVPIPITSPSTTTAFTTDFVAVQPH